MEGKDEVAFFTVLLNRKNIQGITVLESGGAQQFSRQIKAIKNIPNFDNVDSLAVIHDADDNSQRRFQSISSMLTNNGFKVPKKIGSFTSSACRPKVGIFIIPDNINSGMLESLCLSTVQSKELIKCIDSFIECAQQASQKDNVYKQPKNLEKARCRAFLSTMEEDTPSLGVAGRKDYWNWDSGKLVPLLDFLKSL